MSSTLTKQDNPHFQAGLKAEAQQNYIEALYRYTASLELAGDHSATWLKIANLYLRMRKYHQSASNFEYLLTLDPDHPQAVYGLAISYFYLGRLEEACELIDRAVQLMPDNATFALDRAHIRSIKDTDPQSKLSLYRDWGRRFADPLLIEKPFDLDRNPDRVLRIGYVSGDMREHSVAFFMEPVFKHHNKEKVDVFVFSTSAMQDAMTDKLKKHVPNWFSVAHMDDTALYNLIRKKRIDILVDLSGHTQGHRLGVFARRAAPIQVTWLGYMGGTLGMQAMDYRLTDFTMDPPGNERQYVEQLFRLNCMASYMPPQHAPLEPLPPVMRGNPPSLISLNNSKKITDDMLILWRRILEKRPDAQLIIHVQESSMEDAIETIQPRLEKLNLPLDRILVSPAVPLEEFMERGALADVALDTAPISGGTTTLHTLWMGLPIITMRGDEAVSASTAATLNAFKLNHWVAENADEYVDKVLALLEHPEQLAEHRATIREKMLVSPMMDYGLRCTELQSSYRRMWFNYLLGEKRILDAKVSCKEIAEHLRLEFEPVTQ